MCERKAVLARGKCGSCKHWNFKVKADKSMGQCLNEEVSKSTRISIVHCQSLTPEQRTEIGNYARIYFEEWHFGCIRWENKHVEMNPWLRLGKGGDDAET